MFWQQKKKKKDNNPVLWWMDLSSRVGWSGFFFPESQNHPKKITKILTKFSITINRCCKNGWSHMILAKKKKKKKFSPNAKSWKYAWSSGKAQDSWSLDHQCCEFKPQLWPGHLYPWVRYLISICFVDQSTSGACMLWGILQFKYWWDVHLAGCNDKSNSTLYLYEKVLYKCKLLSLLLKQFFSFFIALSGKVVTHNV